MLKDLILARFSWNFRRAILLPVRTIPPHIDVVNTLGSTIEGGVSKGGYEQYGDCSQVATPHLSAFGKGLRYDTRVTIH
jgi:hypothetical protein